MPPAKTFPLATALRTGLKGYSAKTFRNDLAAGLVVSMVALPLAMALSIAVGLPPQNGLYTAIVAGVAAALLGGSPTQVSGPTAAFVVIVAPIVSEFGLAGLVWCQIIAGLALIVLGTARMGRYISFVPYPVTTGFTAGIAVVIATLALNDFLGLGIAQLSGHYIDKAVMIAKHIPSLNPYECAVGMVTLLTIVFSPRLVRAAPPALTGIAAGTLLAWFFAQNGADIATIASRFTFETAAGTGHGIPPLPPSFHVPSLEGVDFRALIGPSLTIAALAALESLLSATVADGMAGTRHDPNAELNGIGIANILSGLVSGIPATGAIARTSANIHAGAKTPLASVIHALLILLYMLMFAPLIGHIPMTSLAALLLTVAWRMSHARQFVNIIRLAPGSDTAVLLTCFGLTVFVDMVAGVGVGFVLASLLFMKRIADMTQIDISPLPEERRGQAAIPLPERVMVYRITGPLFFGTVEKAFDRYSFIHDHVDTLLIDMENVPLIDMSGLVAMKSMLVSIAREGRTIILCGKDDVTGRILRKIAGTDAAPHVKAAASVAGALTL